MRKGQAGSPVNSEPRKEDRTRAGGHKAPMTGMRITDQGQSPGNTMFKKHWEGQLARPAGEVASRARKRISRLRDQCPCQVQQTVSETKTRNRPGGDRRAAREAAGWARRPAGAATPTGRGWTCQHGLQHSQGPSPRVGHQAEWGREPLSMHSHIELGRVSLGRQAHQHAKREHQPHRRGLGAASPEPAEESGRLGASASGPGPAPAPGIERQGAVR